MRKELKLTQKRVATVNSEPLNAPNFGALFSRPLKLKVQFPVGVSFTLELKNLGLRPRGIVLFLEKVSLTTVISWAWGCMRQAVAVFGPSSTIWHRSSVPGLGSSPRAAFTTSGYPNVVTLEPVPTDPVFLTH